jgi:ERCC4-type nuclease
MAFDAGFTHLVLVVEGRMRPGTSGYVEIPRAKSWLPIIPEIEYSRFDSYLTQLAAYGGVIVKRSESVKETAEIIRSVYHTFQTAPEDHDSLHAIYTEPFPGPVSLFHPPSLLRRIAKELPGIGWKRSAAVSERFDSVQEMFAAGVDEWRQIPGIGKKTAENVRMAITVSRGNSSSNGGKINKE